MFPGPPAYIDTLPSLGGGEITVPVPQPKSKFFQTRTATQNRFFSNQDPKPESKYFRSEPIAKVKNLAWTPSQKEYFKNTFNSLFSLPFLLFPSFFFLPIPGEFPSPNPPPVSLYDPLSKSI